MVEVQSVQTMAQLNIGHLLRNLMTGHTHRLPIVLQNSDGLSVSECGLSFRIDGVQRQSEARTTPESKRAISIPGRVGEDDLTFLERQGGL